MYKHYATLFCVSLIFFTPPLQCMNWLRSVYAAAVAKASALLPKDPGVLKAQIKDAFIKTGLPSAVWPIVCQYSDEQILITTIQIPSKGWPRRWLEHSEKDMIVTVAFIGKSRLRVLLTNDENADFCAVTGRLVEHTAAHIPRHLLAPHYPAGKIFVAHQLVNDSAKNDWLEAHVVGPNDISKSGDVKGPAAVPGCCWFEDATMHGRTSIDIFEHSGQKLANVLGVAFKEREEKKEE